MAPLKKTKKLLDLFGSKASMNLRPASQRRPPAKMSPTLPLRRRPSQKIGKRIMKSTELLDSPPDSPVHNEPPVGGPSSSAGQPSLAANSRLLSHLDPPNEVNIPLGTNVDFPPGTKLIHGFVAPGTIKTFYGTKVPTRLVKKKRTIRPTAQSDANNSSPAQPLAPLPPLSQPNPVSFASTQNNSLPPPLSLAPMPFLSQPNPVDSASTQNVSAPPPPPLSIAPMPPLSHPTPASSAPPNPPMPPISQPASPTLPDSPVAEPPVDAQVPKSIRCKGSRLAVGGENPKRKRGKRGVVNGTRLEQAVKFRNGEKIVVEVGPDGVSPADKDVRSLLTHAIGSCVRENVPMTAPTFADLPDNTYKTVLDHLRTFFVIKEQWLKDFILSQIPIKFRAWKHTCKVFYEENGANVIPSEFTHRLEEWQWLVNHFQEPGQQAKCSTMQNVAKCKILRHHSGKLAFQYRAERHYQEGHRAVWIATFDDVYGPDPHGASLAKEMKEKVDELLEPAGGDDYGSCEDPLSIEAQVEIIDEAMGKCKGTGIGGVGKSIKQPPLSRGGNKQKFQAYLDLQEELAKRDAEYAKKEADFEARIRALEEQGRLGSVHGGLAGAAASEGASCANPNTPNMG